MLEDFIWVLADFKCIFIYRLEITQSRGTRGRLSGRSENFMGEIGTSEVCKTGNFASPDFPRKSFALRARFFLAPKHWTLGEWISSGQFVATNDRFAANFYWSEFLKRISLHYRNIKLDFIYGLNS